MNRFGKLLYRYLHDDIINCGKKGLSKQAETECCFQKAESYLKRLQLQLKEYGFKTSAEEISFFKTCKPLFVSEIEYYSLVYHAQLFRPYDFEERDNFWMRESCRLEKFIKDNEEFYHYYKTGKTEWDEVYFVRANADVMPANRAVEIDRAIATSHDGLVSTLLALEKYDVFVKEQLKLINYTETD